MDGASATCGSLFGPADAGQPLMWSLAELDALANTDRDLSPLRPTGKAAVCGERVMALFIGGETSGEASGAPTCAGARKLEESLPPALNKQQGCQRRSWSRCEDELIRTLVTRNGHRWQAVAQAIPGRSPAAIRNRWTRLQHEVEQEIKPATQQAAAEAQSGSGDDGGLRVAPMLRHDSSSSSCSSAPGEDRTKWAAEEDAIILRCVNEFGKKWRVCAELLPGRTENAIRNRFHRLLTRVNFERGGWHPEEDELILKSREQLGNQWCKIAARIPGRSDDAVRNRYKRLQAAGGCSGDLSRAAATALVSSSGASLHAPRSNSEPLMLPLAPRNEVVASCSASPEALRSHSAPHIATSSSSIEPASSSAHAATSYSSIDSTLLEELRALRPR